MANYDINKPFRRHYKLGITDLCNEIQREDEDTYSESLAQNSYSSKFKNSDKSGLVDKLNSCLSFDIEAIAGKNDEERFAMLRLLKLLYRIEKDGSPKKDIHQKNKKIRITDVLKAPHLENICTKYSQKSIYGKIFEDLLKSIEARVLIEDTSNYKDKRKQTFRKINYKWQTVTTQINDYVITDEAIANPNLACKELDRIDHFLNTKIYDRIKDIDPTKISATDGVINTFYSILASHKMLCTDLDKIRINDEISDIQNKSIKFECYHSIQRNLRKPSKIYLDCYYKYQDSKMDWSEASDFANYIFGKNGYAHGRFMTGLLTYEKEIAPKDRKHYRYAINKAPVVARWIKTNKRYYEDEAGKENEAADGDFSTSIFRSVFIAIVQEIFYCKKFGGKIHNDYYGFKGKARTLLSAIKNPESADAIAVYA